METHMKYILRKYQDEAVTAGVKSLLHSDSNNLMSLPSGSGKSLIIAEICHRLDKPVLILQPDATILEQNHGKLLSYGITDIGIYSASAGEKTIGKYTLGTIGSLFKKPELFKHFKYVIQDECQCYNSKKSSMYNKLFRAMGNPHVLGISATLFRLEQRFLRKRGNFMEYTGWTCVLNRIKPFFFKKIVYKISHQELLDQGYLCPIEYIYKDDTFDLSSLELNSNSSNYTDASVEAYVNLPVNITRTISAVADAQSKCKHTLVFCPSISNSERVCEALWDVYKIKAEVTTSSLSAKEQRGIMERFTSGETKVAIVVGQYLCGFDFPALDSIVLARPTFSLALYYQMVCRVVRISPGKEKALVYDCCKNVKRMGRIETFRMTKEDDGFRDRIETEAGVMTAQPMFKFAMKVHDYKKKEPVQTNLL